MGVKDDFLDDLFDDLDNEGETPIVEDNQEKELKTVLSESDYEINKDDMLTDSVFTKPITVNEVLNIEKYKNFYEFMKGKEKTKNALTGFLFYMYAKGDVLNSINFEDSGYYRTYKEAFSLIESEIKNKAFLPFMKDSFREHYDPIVFFTNNKEIFNLIFSHFFKKGFLIIPSSINENWFLEKIATYRKKYSNEDEKLNLIKNIMFFYNRYNNTHLVIKDNNYSDKVENILLSII